MVVAHFFMYPARIFYQSLLARSPRFLFFAPPQFFLLLLSFLLCQCLFKLVFLLKLFFFLFQLLFHPPFLLLFLNLVLLFMSFLLHLFLSLLLYFCLSLSFLLQLFFQLFLLFLLFLSPSFFELTLVTRILRLFELLLSFPLEFLLFPCQGNISLFQHFIAIFLFGVDKNICELFPTLLLELPYDFLSLQIFLLDGGGSLLKINIFLGMLKELLISGLLLTRTKFHSGIIPILYLLFMIFSDV